MIIQTKFLFTRKYFFFKGCNQLKLATISVVPFFQIRRSKMKLVKRERKTETEKRQKETERDRESNYTHHVRFFWLVSSYFFSLSLLLTLTLSYSLSLSLSFSLFEQHHPKKDLKETTGNVTFFCQRFYAQVLVKELQLQNNNATNTYCGVFQSNANIIRSNRLCLNWIKIYYSCTKMFS